MARWTETRMNRRESPKVQSPKQEYEQEYEQEELKLKLKLEERCLHLSELNCYDASIRESPLHGRAAKCLSNNPMLSFCE